MPNNLKHWMFAVALAALLMPFAPAQAQDELISTQQALALESGTAADAVTEWLQREDVAAALAARGVDPALAQQRVAALSPAEIESLAERIDELPAGAGVIEILGVTFLVLLVLDLAGVLNIFTR